MLKQTFVSAVLATAVAGLTISVTGAQTPSAPRGDKPSGLSKTAAQTDKSSGLSPQPAVKPAASHPPAATTMLAAEQTALVKQYCAGCHSERGQAGGLSLAAFDASKLDEHGETEKKKRRNKIRKIRI